MTKEKIKKIRSSIDNLLKTKKIVTIPDVFIDTGVLNVKDYERWRRGQVPYLEKVCNGSLNKLTETIKEIYKYGRELNLKFNTTFYRKFGKGTVKLRFSKFNNEHLEKLYSGTMYRVDNSVDKNEK